MEVYIGPPEAQPDAYLTREQVLTALARANLAVESVAEQPAAHDTSASWTVTFRDTEARLEFQAIEAGLVFATLEHSMFDQSAYPDRICQVLEALGWESDPDNVG
jgi:hypothetical protein